MQRMNKYMPRGAPHAGSVAKSETALREEEVLAFWKEQGIFEKSLAKDAPKGEFVFYDGPPFATGLPHWGSLLSSISKDVFGRYKTMQGYRVPRRWGWDCHGLPIENMIEKKLGLTTKKDIEELGVDRFNEEARAAVLQYAGDWKKYVDRVGRWVDFDHSYKTMDTTYIESVWWALKKIHTDKRLYEGRKVLMYCPRCETPLSKAEIAMDNSYKEVTEKAVYVKFKVKSDRFNVGGPVYILAWTTTPWTLPGNVALAVGKDIEYVLVKSETSLDRGIQGGELHLREGWYIFAKQRLANLIKEGNYFTETKSFSGLNLVGLSYEPLYDIPKAKVAGSERAWTVLSADFVTTEEGTGVVHIAPMYGEDDYKLGASLALPIVPLLDASGVYNADAPESVRGMYYKKGGAYVLEDLAKRNVLFASHDHTHSYPHCYRCGTPLIYNALTSWFIDIQSVKRRLLEANEDVSWYPEHLKHGRFQNIVEGAPDWTISRNRFWASPLPIWKHEKTGEVTVVGSLSELRDRTKKSGNTYCVVRHGQAESNVRRAVSMRSDEENHLTDVGREQAEAVARTLTGVTRIIASPLMRTRETATIIARALHMDEASIVYDERLKEWQVGDFDGKPVADLSRACPTYYDRFMKGCGGGETLLDMKRRIGEALYEYEQTYANETLLIVGHEYTAWLAECVVQGADVSRCIEIRGDADDFIANGELRGLDFVPLSHNKEYERDLHRPYIDELPLVAEDGARLVRIPEVVDCWVESGSMPFASEHFPYENEEVVKRRYPGDFIAEYIAQTRTWFYYMHALGVLLFDAPSFKNCLTTGTLLAADGTKISKSKNNYTDPLNDMDTYGADAGRLYVTGSVVMSAEDLAFTEEELREAHNRFIGILWNSYQFFEMHDGIHREGGTFGTSSHVLDRWIVARLAGLIDEMTTHLDAYNTVRAVRALRDFVTDLSTWYIRRSRDRLKAGDSADRSAAMQTGTHVFRTLATLAAPIVPFIAESIYRGCGGGEESVHLDVWPLPRPTDRDEGLLLDMSLVRSVASLVLEARQRAGIKVRQPLSKVTLSDTRLSGKEELLAILCDEVNVKEVCFAALQEEAAVLDTVITPELKEEGEVRELVRVVQDMRKRAGRTPGDTIVLTVDAQEEAKRLVEMARGELMRVAGVREIIYGTVGESSTAALGGITFSL